MPKKQNSQKRSNHFILKRIIAVVIVVFVLSFTGELLIGNIPYYTKWKECGSQPVIVTHPESIGFGAPRQVIYVVHTHPSFFDEKLPMIFSIGTPVAYCSLDEAQQRYGTNLRIQN